MSGRIKCGRAGERQYARTEGEQMPTGVYTRITEDGRYKWKKRPLKCICGDCHLCKQRVRSAEYYAKKKEKERNSRF